MKYFNLIKKNSTVQENVLCYADLCCLFVHLVFLQFNWPKNAGYQCMCVVDDLCEVTTDTQYYSMFNINKENLYLDIAP